LVAFVIGHVTFFAGRSAVLISHFPQVGGLNALPARHVALLAREIALTIRLFAQFDPSLAVGIGFATPTLRRLTDGLTRTCSTGHGTTHRNR
jgi:hypothetical protein